VFMLIIDADVNANVHVIANVNVDANVNRVRSVMSLSVLSPPPSSLYNFSSFYQFYYDKKPK
jgi:hypothetical protein